MQPLLQKSIQSDTSYILKKYLTAKGISVNTKGQTWNENEEPELTTLINEVGDGTNIPKQPRSCSTMQIVIEVSGSGSTLLSITFPQRTSAVDKHFLLVLPRISVS